MNFPLKNAFSASHRYLESCVFILVAQMVNNLPANAGDPGSILHQEDPLEKRMATHSSILSCWIPWTEEPGGLQSMELLDTTEHLTLSLSPPETAFSSLLMIRNYSTPSATGVWYLWIFGERFLIGSQQRCLSFGYSVDPVLVCGCSCELQVASSYTLHAGRSSCQKRRLPAVQNHPTSPPSASRWSSLRSWEIILPSPTHLNNKGGLNCWARTAWFQ